MAAHMETTEAVEDYLKAIYALGSEGTAVTTGAIAERLGVSSPSVSAMVKRLCASQLVDKGGRGRVTLTADGEVQALRVVRRHRLLETFLERVLDVPWDEVHAEAEVLEHAVSDRLAERIDDALGHPTHDPHGDPIPPPDGGHHERWSEPLCDARAGSSFRVERVSDRDSEALRYLGDLGIRPGAELRVRDRAPFGGPLWVELDGIPHALGLPLARLVHGTAGVAA